MNAGKLAISAALICVFLPGCATAETAPPPPAPALNFQEMATAIIASYPGMTCKDLDKNMETDYLFVVYFERELKKDPEKYKKANPKDMEPMFAPLSKRVKAAYKEYKSRCKGEPAQVYRGEEIEPYQVHAEVRRLSVLRSRINAKAFWVRSSCRAY